MLGRTLIILTLVLGAGVSYAQQEEALASQQPAPLEESCTACHGPQGRSLQPAWPSLADQHKSYLLQQLHAFVQGHEGPRPNAIMQASLEGLPAHDLETLASYFAEQAPALMRAEKRDDLAVGAQLYHRGHAALAIPACAACHGDYGQGLSAARFPKVAGQHAEYLQAQLQAYARRERISSLNGCMNDIAEKLTQEQQAAVAHYLQGLRGPDAAAHVEPSSPESTAVSGDPTD